MEFKEFWKFSSFLMIYVYKYRERARACNSVCFRTSAASNEEVLKLYHDSIHKNL